MFPYQSIKDNFDDYRPEAGVSVTAGGAGAGELPPDPDVAHTMIMISRTAPIAPIISIIFRFCHQYFRFSFPACCSNCAAPCCKASARLSSSDNFWSLSNTFSTLTRIMPTTSSTLAWVWAKRLSLTLGPELPLWSSIFYCVDKLHSSDTKWNFRHFLRQCKKAEI